MAINKEELLQALSELQADGYTIGASTIPVNKELVEKLLPESYQALQDGYKKGDSTTETEEGMEKFLKREKESKEVEVLSKPLVEWFKKNKCPLDMIIVTYDGVSIMSAELFIPTREIINEDEEKEKDTTEAHTASDNKEKKVSEIIEEYYESCARTLTELSKNPAHLVKYVNFINCITDSINKTKETLPASYMVSKGFL